MPANVVLFAGAPEANSLDWDERGLVDRFSDGIVRFAGLDCSTATAVAPDLISPSLAHPAWRSLSLERQHLSTELTQSLDQYRLLSGTSQQRDSQGTTFFTASEISSFIQEQFHASQNGSLESAEQVLSQFYEASYALHQDAPSSQIAPASDFESSFASDDYSFSSSSLNSEVKSLPVPIAAHLSHLNSLPNAAYLASIQPQTMTVDLIVGIISIPEPRRIKTRRGAEVKLIEVLVGDETKSGFGVNFWIDHGKGGEMSRALESLRNRDVVLMRNVALSEFRGRVYGQSLRKEITKLYLLYRDKVDKEDVGGCYRKSDLEEGEGKHPQVEKTRKVREWVLRFVGVGTGARSGGRAGGWTAEAVREVLPPDTQ